MGLEKFMSGIKIKMVTKISASRMLNFKLEVEKIIERKLEGKGIFIKYLKYFL